MSVERKIQSHKYGVLGRRKSASHVLPVEPPDMLPSNLLKSPTQNSRSLKNLSTLSQSSESFNDLELNDDAFAVSSAMRVYDTENMRPVALEEELQSRVHQLTGLLRQSQRRAQQYKAHAHALTAQIQQVREDSAQYVHSLQNEHQHTLKGIKHEMSGIMAAKAKLEQEYTTLQTSFRNNLEQNKSDMENWHERWKQRTVDIEKLRSSNSSMGNEIGLLRKQIKTLRKDNELLVKQNKAIKSELDNITLQTEQNKSKPCSCMGSEYKVLFELTMLRVKSLEQQNKRHVTKTISNLDPSRTTLLQSVMDLAKLAGGEIEVVTDDHNGESTDSCGESPRSPTLTYKNAVNNNIIKSKPVPSPHTERPISPLETTVPLSPQDYSHRNCSSFSSITKPAVNGHESHLDGDFRKRAFSELVRGGRRRHPLTKGFSSEDHRITLDKLNHRNSSASSVATNSSVATGSSTDVFMNGDPHVEKTDIRPQRVSAEFCHSHVNQNIMPSEDKMKPYRSHEQLPLFNKEISQNQNGGHFRHHSTDGSKAEVTHVQHGDNHAASGFDGLRSRRNGITEMPLDVSVALRFQDVKKSKEFSHLLSKFTKDKPPIEHESERKFSAIRRLSRKKSKPSLKD